MTQFTFNPVTSNDAFEFVDADGTTFSFAGEGAQQSFSFTEDSEGRSLTFIELSPNQTIGTVNNIGGITNIKTGADSEWVLKTIDSDYIQERVGQAASVDSEFITNIIDSDYVQARVGSVTVDSEFITNIIDSDYVQARVGSVTVDSEFVQSVSLVEKQLEGYQTTIIPGQRQVEEASGNGGFFNTNAFTAVSEKVQIVLDSEWNAVNVPGVSNTLTVTGNFGSNRLSIDLDGTYLRQSLDARTIVLSGATASISTSTNSNHWWFNATNGVSIYRVTQGGPGQSELWRFVNGNMATLSGSIYSRMVTENFADGTQGDFAAGLTPSGTIKASASSGTGTFGTSAVQKLTYAFSVPSLPRAFSVVFNDSDTITQAVQKIGNAWDSETPFTVTTNTATRTVSIDTKQDSDINNATITVTNFSSSVKVLFNGSSGTSFTVTDGGSSMNTTKSIVSYRNIAYAVPLGYKDSDFYREFALLENVTGISFVYDSENNKLIGTFDSDGIRAASGLSVNHGGKDGTFAWDSDFATITQRGASSGPSTASRDFFNTIYNEDRVIQTIESFGGTGGTSLVEKADSDWTIRQINTQVLDLRAETGTTPVLADFNGAILLGEY